MKYYYLYSKDFYNIKRQLDSLVFWKLIDNEIVQIRRAIPSLRVKQLLINLTISYVPAI